MRDGNPSSLHLSLCLATYWFVHWFMYSSAHPDLLGLLWARAQTLRQIWPPPFSGPELRDSDRPGQLPSLWEGSCRSTLCRAAAQPVTAGKDRVLSLWGNQQRPDFCWLGVGRWGCSPAAQLILSQSSLSNKSVPRPQQMVCWSQAIFVYKDPLLCKHFIRPLSCLSLSYIYLCWRSLSICFHFYETLAFQRLILWPIYSESSSCRSGLICGTGIAVCKGGFSWSWEMS